VIAETDSAFPTRADSRDPEFVVQEFAERSLLGSCIPLRGLA
jgi:hypothetical protein